MTAEILTSRPDSPWTLTSPNLCSIRTDCPAPSVNVLSKLRVTSSCALLPAANLGDAASRRTAASPAPRRAPPKRSLSLFNENNFIAFPPKYPPAFAVFPDTSPAVAAGDAHWTDSFRPAREDRRWRYPAPAASRGNSPGKGSQDSRAPVWLRQPAYRLPGHKLSGRAPPRQELDSSEETGHRSVETQSDANKPSPRKLSRSAPSSQPRRFAIPERGQIQARARPMVRSAASWRQLLRSARARCETTAKGYRNTRAFAVLRRSALSRSAAVRSRRRSSLCGPRRPPIPPACRP